MVHVANTWFIAKIMSFDESTILLASQVDHTAPQTTSTAAKATNTCYDTAARILDADSHWLLSLPPVSSDVVLWVSGKNAINYRRYTKVVNYHFYD